MTPEEKKAYDEAVARAKEMLAAQKRAAKAAKKDKK